MAVQGVEAIGSIFYSAILQGGPMGNDEVEDLEKEKETERMAEEDNNQYIESVD
jgi:hypothetical protein